MQIAVARPRRPATLRRFVWRCWRACCGGAQRNSLRKSAIHSAACPRPECSQHRPRSACARQEHRQHPSPETPAASDRRGSPRSPCRQLAVRPSLYPGDPISQLRRRPSPSCFQSRKPGPGPHRPSRCLRDRTRTTCRTVDRPSRRTPRQKENSVYLRRRLRRLLDPRGIQGFEEPTISQDQRAGFLAARLTALPGLHSPATRALRTP